MISSLRLTQRPVRRFAALERSASRTGFGGGPLRAGLAASLCACACLCAAPSLAAKKPDRHNPPAPQIEFRTPAPGTPLEPAGAPVMPPYSARDHFSFVVLGDSAPPAPDMPSPIALFRIYDDLGNLRPDLIFHTGNAIYAKPDDGDGAQLQLQRFRLAADTLPPIPYYVAPGSKDIPDETADVVFRKAISGGQPWRSFDYGNSHFVVLDTEVPNETGRISGEQLDWLKSDLAKASQAAHIFVFLNRTPFPSGTDVPAAATFASNDDRDSFVSLMSQYHVNTVFSGGQAMYAALTRDGVRYINTGGGGSPSAVSPADGGFLHYVYARIDGDNVVLSPLDPTRISVRTMLVGPGSISVYNSSSIPLVLNNIAVAVPVAWRTGKQGRLPAELVQQYKVSATANTGGISQDIDAAAVTLKQASNSGGDANQDLNVDYLIVRLVAPPASVVTINVNKPS